MNNKHLNGLLLALGTAFATSLALATPLATNSLAPVEPEPCKEQAGESEVEQTLDGTRPMQDDRDDCGEVECGVDEMAVENAKVKCGGETEMSGSHGG